MKAFDRLFHGEQAAIRSYLFAKLFLAILALDAWMLMIGHAGRYGAGDFNVAHFAWLDALQPVPTPALYIGVLTLLGLLALALALWTPHPAGVAVLCVLYTYSWAMSMLDSYQHHYFVSLCLVCLVFFPRVDAATIHPPGLDAGQLSDKQRKRRRHDLDRARGVRRAGWVYLAAIAAMVTAYLAWGAEDHPYLGFGLCALGIFGASLLYRPESPATGAGPAKAKGFGYPLLCMTTAILYSYTTLAKTDAGWLQGHTIRQISTVEQVYAPLHSWATGMGLSSDAFWAYISIGVLPLEAMVAFGYVAATQADTGGHRALRWLCLLSWALAMALHLGAEAMGLQIGWFSYYMILFAWVVLLPEGFVDRFGTIATWPARTLRGFLQAWDEEDRDKPGSARSTTLVLGGMVALALGFVGYKLDLPGTQTACLLAAAAVVGATGLSVVRGRPTACRGPLLATLGAAGLMWLAIGVSDVRWEFYRYLGGDLARRNQTEAAIQTYLKGERYAPPGQTRMDKVQMLRRKLGE